ncbi:MAG TPA: sigma 54-interacting transcriptional regulator [Myxococcota bacterium]|nr:sigma 54-interacting transcriptional regulator [Myxococcota bacterium]
MEVKFGTVSQRFDIYKRLTSIGSDKRADVSIAHEGLFGIAAYISHSNEQFNLIIPAERKSPQRNVLLHDGDHFSLGPVHLTFWLEDPLPTTINPDPHQGHVLAYRRLLDFSQRIAEEKDIEALLKTLLKGITELTGAEHGFLVLIEEGAFSVKVQECGQSGEDFNHIGTMSDSIVKKVIETKEAIIVNDALNHHEFSTSVSVINFRLSSVMCVPLIYQGSILGAIYVGNNSLVNAFDNDKLELMTIYSSQAAMLLQNALYINALKKRTKNLAESLELTKFGGLIGSCPGMQQVFSQVEKVAQTDISVLITGETGTGKELVARELHNRSHRNAGPFVIINCGAIPKNLLESELFGHVRGAFSGATHSRVGKFQSANNGTLFIDEISEVPIHLHLKLLTALKDLVVTKVGENKSESVNIRVIAATNRNLSSMVQQGEFREDLYDCLNVVHIAVPPLKERGNDVLVIANFFLQKFAKIYGKNVVGLLEEAQNALLNYHWPGNVRQLENRMRRAIIMCDHERISAKDLDLMVESTTRIVHLSDALERYRIRYIDESLERNAGNRTKTASELGVDPRTIFRHLESKRKASEEGGIIN